MMGPEMLTSTSTSTDYIRVINEMQTEIFQLKAHIAGTAIHSPGGHAGGEKEMTRWRSIQAVPKFTGDDKIFKDFDFKLHQFVRPIVGFEKTLDWIKDQDGEPDQEKIAEYKVETGFAVEYLNDQLYGILAFVAEGNALNTVINLQEAHEVRGFHAWYRLTRDATGKTGTRLKRLTAKVHQPKQITDYKNALVDLTAWDTSLKDLVKIEGQNLSELTKVTILTNMVPADLMRDIDRDKSLKSFDSIWNYVIE